MPYKSKSCMLFLKAAIVAVVIVLVFGIFKDTALRKFVYPKKFSTYVETYSKEYNLDENLVYAVIKCESGFKSDAISARNARGLMQISEITGLWAAEVLKINDYKHEMLFEPETNILIGCWYLRKMLDQFGSESTALAAYNAGSGNVSGWLSKSEYTADGVNLHSIPFGETENYVRRVETAKKMYEYLYN